MAAALIPIIANVGIPLLEKLFPKIKSWIQDAETLIDKKIVIPPGGGEPTTAKPGEDRMDLVLSMTRAALAKLWATSGIQAPMPSDDTLKGIIEGIFQAQKAAGALAPQVTAAPAAARFYIVQGLVSEIPPLK